MHHVSAFIDPSAKIAPSVKIGPFAVIEGGVELHDGVVIGPHAVIHSGTIVEKNVNVGPHAIIGGLPQSHNFDPNIPTFVRIGEGTIIREGVTVHRATLDGQSTIVGKNNLLMAYAHVAHDVVLEDNVTMANSVLLGGFVHVEKGVTIGGGAAIHQKVRVGRLAMVGGVAIMTYDVPPYTVSASRNVLYGLNLVGLKRSGFNQEVIGDIKRAYKAVYGNAGNLVRAAQLALSESTATTPEGQHFLEFFLNTQRKAFVRPRFRDGGEENKFD